ncbi:MAG: bile acid:sodium symporter [Neisseriaceae bacterium]|nr:bile acid:sodium symporter [Neisseriaceae bacterium]
MTMKLTRFLPDKFTMALIGAVVLASVLPSQGRWVPIMDGITVLAIGLLFFLHGAKLSRRAVIEGMGHWRLHSVVFTFTYLIFPLLIWLGKPLLLKLVSQDLYWGLLYMALLPSTVQSSIAFVAVARGNVPAAICSATASNILGIFLTPLLVGWIILGSQSDAAHSGALEAILDIVYQLLLPFIAGQIARRWIGVWVDKHKPVLAYVDQSSILLVVYTAFSAAVVSGLWQATPWVALVNLVVISCVLLALVLGLTRWVSTLMGFNKADEITIVFCGSKKSMATGIPMAQVLFAGTGVSMGAMVLPLMLFHQIQLMVCAVIAARYQKRLGDE